MTKWVYFDTCALVLWAEGDVRNPDARSKLGREEMCRLLKDANVVASLSEYSIIEYFGVLTSHWRTSSKPQFSGAWVTRSTKKLMQEIADDRILVVPTPTKAAEHAATLVTIATRDHKMSFKVWDACHLITAAAWADSLGNTVEIVTCDNGFDRFVSLYPYFGRYVTITNTG